AALRDRRLHGPFRVDDRLTRVDGRGRRRWRRRQGPTEDRGDEVEGRHEEDERRRPEQRDDERAAEREAEREGAVQGQREDPVRREELSTRHEERDHRGFGGGEEDRDRRHQDVEQQDRQQMGANEEDQEDRDATADIRDDEDE